MKIGFIGAGNMAQAIIDGLIKTGTVAAADIVIHGGTPAHYEAYAATSGVATAPDNASVVAQSDVVVLAVKPRLASDIIAEIHAPLFDRRPVLVSLMTGVSILQIEGYLGTKDYPLVRTMPNLNVAIGAGMTAYAANPAAQPALAAVVGLFKALGETIPLAEAHFSTFVALAGSSPAFVYLFIDALSRAGVKYGLTKAEATKIAAQAVLGSGAMVLQSPDSPFDLIDKVSSPGGTTVAGLLAMEAAGFMGAVVTGVDATIAKDQED
ncbi:pyrroline-5-carboxylate reductase [Lacticaseibacillus parakribbianus]|uniref:pyrroline-5-carboxylate reductase n=1 Tax=Lacticaseibacillus parakribbianus TaxID=2970927 RepID=UPI0021CB83C0|nr:pyrroline-5-carboxylate reductase [Lacticaseibacillus parakribbianus]